MKLMISISEIIQMDDLWKAIVLTIIFYFFFFIPFHRSIQTHRDLNDQYRLKTTAQIDEIKE